jgi:hypothetical protein
MRIVGFLRLSAALAALAFCVLAVTAHFAFRRALAAKIDHAQEIEQRAARPASAARLASALLERRLSQVTESRSQPVAAAFQHSDASQALADYRAAGGDPSIIAEVEKTLAGQKPPDPQVEIALMRAIRGLRAESAKAPRVSRPPPPGAASEAGSRLLAAGAAAAVALLFAYLAGRFERARSPERP